MSDITCPVQYRLISISVDRKVAGFFTLVVLVLRDFGGLEKLFSKMKFFLGKIPKENYFGKSNVI